MTNTTDRGPWMRTHSGTRFHPFDPHADEVCIEDIAHALSQLCRFAGHTSAFYSVASHSVLVADLVVRLGHPEHALSALLHDAAEAYYVDVPSPLKRGLPDYRSAIGRGEDVIARAFGLPVELPRVVVRADLMALADEARDLMGGHEGWGLPEPESGIRVLSESPSLARDRFLERFHALQSARAA